MEMTVEQAGRRPRSSWPDDRTEAVKEAFFAGKSFGLIAKEFKTSRNVISGKALREGWKRPATLEQLTPSAPSAPSKPRKARAAKQEPTGMRWARLEDLEDRECRWPLAPDHEGVMLFCGCAQKPDSRYCEGHHARAYRAGPPVELEPAVSKRPR